MKWNPFVNAALAVIYIGAVVIFMQFIESIRRDTPDTLIDGMGFISLFVSSVAVMGFLFFYQPAVLLSQNKKNEAVGYFLKTLAVFGVMTVCMLIFVSMQ